MKIVWILTGSFGHICVVLFNHLCFDLILQITTMAILNLMMSHLTLQDYEAGQMWESWVS